MAREFQDYINAANETPYLSFDIPGVLSVDEATPAEFLKELNPQLYKERFDAWFDSLKGYLHVDCN